MNKEMRNYNQKNPPKQQQKPKFNNNKNYNNNSKQPQQQQQQQQPEQGPEPHQPSKQKLISKSQLQNNIDQPQIQILSRNKPNEAKPSATPSKSQPHEQANKSANNQTPHKDLASLFKPPNKTHTPDSNSHLSSKNRANFSNNSNSTNGLGNNNNNSSSNNVLLGILKNSSFTSITTPVVPVGTSEQSPAPSQLPIPFGLSPSAKNSARRNVLLDKLGVATATTSTSTPPSACSFANALNNADYLNSMNSLPVNLFSEPDKPFKDPLAVLFPNSGRTLCASSLEQNLFKLSAENSEFDNFNKLNKINKLRNALRADKDAGKHRFDDNYNLIDYFKKACADNSVKLDYVQYSQPESYYGELLLESFRLLCESNKKRKKCSYYAHKNALDLLCSSSELAVKVAPKLKRDASMKLDDENGGGQMAFSDLFKASKKYENSSVEFEYELHRVDSNQGSNQLMSDVPCTSAPKSKMIDSSLLSSFSLPAVVDTSKTEASIQDLNALLKSLILKPQNVAPNNGNSNSNHLEGSCINASTNDDSKESQINDNENEDEDDDDNKSQGMDKKTKIKQNLENFCLYVSAQGPNESLELHERNSLQILTTSCNKSNCNLEFELKHKSSNNKSTKTIISGDRIQSESDDELNGDAKQKYK
jgi:hypothetical protein